MTLEQRLRDAMQARVESVNAPELRARAERPRRVWPALAAGFAIVVVVALVVALMARDNGDPTPPASTPYPSRVVVVSYDGKLQVLDSRTGRAIRTLAADADPEGGLAVDPRGRTIYYTRFVADSACGSPVEEPLREIARVRVSGGEPVSMVFGVRSPAISPDGRYLAFTGVPDCSDAGSAVVVRDLRSNDNSSRTWFADQPTNLGIDGLSWSADGRSILFHWRDDPTGYSTRILDTRNTGTAIERAAKVAADKSVVCCYLGSTGDLLGNMMVPGSDEELGVAAIDLGSGHPTLLTCCGAAITADRSGRSVLVHTSDGRGGLLRWQRGTRRPVWIRSDVRDARWLPGS